MLLGNKIAHTLELRDVTSKGAPKSWPLPAPPGDIVYDATTNTAYVTQDDTNSVAVIDLGATSVSQVSLTRPALRLALGEPGQVFATVAPIVADVRVALITGGAAVELTVPPQTSPLIAYDRATKRLYLGDRGSSPSSLQRYAFDAAAKTLTLEQERLDAGGNGQDLTLSPDGHHLVFSCGGGNGAGYTMFDFNPENLDANFGEWDTGAYPRSAAFEPNGKRLLASNGFQLFVFDAATYATIFEDKPTICTYGSLDRVAVSPGGHIFYAITKCGFDADTGNLHWFVH
ncbi:hypothetical protein A7982_12227 [Minicystis rosea]|nr:hypothetical protein A7982_12227 [Minicystis rosea]